MSGNELRIALAQMEVLAGQPSRNLEQIACFVDRAKDAKADIVVFPELALGGRYLGAKWHDAEYVSYVASFSEKVRELSDGIGIVFGNTVPIANGAYLLPTDEADAYFSSALFCANGEWIEPTICDCDGDCDCEDEGHCHEEGGCGCDDGCCCGNEVYRFPFGDAELHISVLTGDLSGGREEVSGFLVDYLDGECDLAIDLCAKPWCLHAMDSGFSLEESEVFGDELPPVVRVNCVGMQNTDKSVLSFDGGSCLYFQGRKVAACRDDFQEDFLVVDVDLGGAGVSVGGERESAPYGDDDEKVLDAIIWALRRFDQQVFPFHPKWVIGLSGGLDSSVTACLMHLAFGGPDRIVGYNLATRYNSDATKANAYHLAKELGIRLANGSIEGLVKATGETVALYGYPDGSTAGLVQENIQARLRGHLLSTFAAIEGGVIMNNGNKVEATFGYATLYGDAVGAISPIGDITKVRLFELARIINRRYGKAVVPENLLPQQTEDGYVWETMPSAELKDAQKDPMKWFYHDWIVEQLVDDPGFSVEGLMESYLEDRLASSPVGKWVRFYGLDDPAAFIEDLEWVVRQIGNSVFKRIQMPPTIAVVRSTTSYDYRENQLRVEPTERFAELKRAILSL